MQKISPAFYDIWRRSGTQMSTPAPDITSSVDECWYFQFCSPDVSEPPILKSCAKLLEVGYTNDGYYYIDPDGPSNGVDSFAVYCDMSTGLCVAILHYHGEVVLNWSPKKSIMSNFIFQPSFETSLWDTLKYFNYYDKPLDPKAVP